MDAQTHILEALDGAPDRRVLMPGLAGSARAYIAGALVRAGRVPVLIADSPEDAEVLYRDLNFMLGASDDTGSTEGILFFGADEKSPYEAHSPDPRAVMERIATLYRLSRERANVRAVIVTPRAFVRRLIPPSVFERAFEYLVAGEEIERDRLLENALDRIDHADGPLSGNRVCTAAWTDAGAP